jgi:hypothetical protein
MGSKNYQFSQTGQFKHKLLSKIVLLSHLEIVKDVSKEILRWSLIETRKYCVGATLNDEVNNIFHEKGQ